MGIKYYGDKMAREITFKQDDGVTRSGETIITCSITSVIEQIPYKPQ
jgi:hypothetical protein